MGLSEVDRYQEILDRFELILRKMGHDPSLGWVERSRFGQYAYRCKRCGYQWRIEAVDEDHIAACLVDDDEQVLEGAA